MPTSTLSVRYLSSTTSSIFMAASRWARQCCEIRGSRQWSCVSVSRRIGARRAGPSAAVRSARQTSNAAPILHRCIEMSLFAELKRRNVFRFAGLYLVGSWLLVQVASTVLPMFGAPDWLPRSVVILLAIGFLPALIFSWVFELTPQGLKRDDDVRPEESIAPQTARRMDRMIIVVLVLALAYFAVDKFLLNQRQEKSTARMPSSE